jgi:hypothetical protein
MNDGILKLLTDRFIAALNGNADLDEVKVLHQLLMAEKEFCLALCRLISAERKQSGPSESFGAKEYNEAIDCMLGKEAR